MISLQGAMLTASYVRRAIRESDGSLFVSLERQMQLAAATCELLRTLDRFCGCTDALAPLEYVHCPPCTLRLRVVHVMMSPQKHTSAQHQRVIDSASDVLRASGYLS